MCFHNLFRRRTRTFLTVTGVVIGTCSIVLMMSLGVGLQSVYMGQMTQWTDLTMIQVYDNSGDMEKGGSSGEKEYLLNDEAVDYFNSLSHVEGVTPILRVDSSQLRITSGKYRFQGNVVGMNLDVLEKMGFVLEDGRMPSESDGPAAVVMGNKTGYDFYDEESNEYIPPYDQEGNLLDPRVDVMKNPVKISITEMPQSTWSEQMDRNPKRAQSVHGIPVKINDRSYDKLRVTGKLKEDQGKEYATYSGVFVSVDFAKQLMAQAANLRGDKYVFKNYPEVKIKVDSFENVADVEQQIKSFGFITYSATQELDQMKMIARIIQAVLGALGGISLLVAAIGITNTMVMSIYERTKEIGIMKVLGCEVKNIRALFLMEAGGIGLLGGLIGLFISYLISITVNFIAGQIMGTSLGFSANISQIPVWLALLGIGFSVVVGLLAGYAPANRAVKISALSAIKTE